MTPTRTLLALAALALPSVAGAAQAVMIADDSFRLNLDAAIATRIEHASADDAAGGDWDAVLARPGRGDQLDFSVRRARFGLSGGYGAGYRFAVTVRADDVDARGDQTGRTVDLYKAWVDRDFASGEVTNTVHLGLDQPYFNRSQTIEPYWLFPQQRASGALMSPRGVGARYKLTSPSLDLGFDVMNNLDQAKPAANAGKADGLFYSARLEFSALDGPKAQYRESWAGEPGESVLLAMDVGYDDNDYAIPGIRTDRIGYGIEGLAHYDEFSGLIELRFLRESQSSFNGTPTASVAQRVFIAQAGWAIAIERGVALEPAVRLELIDLDTSNDSEAVTYDGGPHNPGTDAEWGDSGRQIDLGLNLYLARQANKLQLSYSHWEAESGNGKAEIFRFQHQLFF
jgi:hypothetical protein